jgi:hypothetical protein
MGKELYLFPTSNSTLHFFLFFYFFIFCEQAWDALFFFYFFCQQAWDALGCLGLLT